MIPPPVLLIRASALLQPSSHLPALFEVVTTTMLDPKHSRRRQQHALPAQPTCYSETATDIGCHQKNQSRIPLVSHTTTARQWGGQVKSPREGFCEIFRITVCSLKNTSHAKGPKMHPTSVDVIPPHTSPWRGMQVLSYRLQHELKSYDQCRRLLTYCRSPKESKEHTIQLPLDPHPWPKSWRDPNTKLMSPVHVIRKFASGNIPH